MSPLDEVKNEGTKKQKSRRVERMSGWRLDVSTTEGARESVCVGGEEELRD